MAKGVVFFVGLYFFSNVWASLIKKKKKTSGCKRKHISEFPLQLEETTNIYASLIMAETKV